MQPTGKRVRECEERGFSLELNSPQNFSPKHILQNPDPFKYASQKLKQQPPKSFEERLRLYNIKRDEIFNESLSICSDVKPTVTFKIYGVRQRFKARKTYLKNMSSTQFDKCEDTRRFATVYICDSPINGLLDSGANITCLGNNAMNFIKENSLTVISFHASVRTANGSPAAI